jgi:hypothetical protein
VRLLLVLLLLLLLLLLALPLLLLLLSLLLLLLLLLLVSIAQAPSSPHVTDSTAFGLMWCWCLWYCCTSSSSGPVQPTASA